MIHAQVDGRLVKNLGWLLRNWRDVATFEVWPHPYVGGGGMEPDCKLVARMRDNRVFETGFMSKEVLARFLCRPVFEGLRVRWEVPPPFDFPPAAVVWKLPKHPPSTFNK